MFVKLDMSRSYDRKDHLYRQAKAQGYRSRAAFKLKEINARHRIIRSAAHVLDLGAWPGGWMQVAAEFAGPKGLVVGIDLEEIEDFGMPGVIALKGDVRDEKNIQQALALSAGPFESVLSDMSAKLSGIREVDEAASVSCAELALWAAGKTLKNGGALVVKVFKNPGIEEFVKNMRSLFNKVTRAELDSSRKTSNEFYLIGTGYRNKA